MTTAQLKWREKISYGVADMGFNFYWATISTFLMIYYTDVFGISAAAAASMMAAIKIINAFTDPMIGAAADRTTTRFGKFRPYLIFMAIPLALAAVLTFTTPNLSEEGKTVWAFGTYLAMMVCYTCINIPYNALSGVISSDPQERSTVNGLRFIFAFAGSALVVKITPDMVTLFGGGDEKSGWQLTMLAWSIAASILFSITFFNTRERVAPLAQQKSNVLQDIKDLTKNRPWVVLFFLALIIMITITLRNMTAAYYCKYYVGQADLIKNLVFLYMISAAAGAALTPVMTKYIDKKKLMMILMGLTGIISCGFFYIPPDQIFVMYAMQVALGFVLGPKSPLAFSMYADTADYNEWLTGRRATAMTFAAATFSQKLGTALASVVIGGVFTALGYVANAAQSSESQQGIVLLMSIIPGCFAFLAAAIMFLYNLDNKTLAKVQEELDERKAAALI